MTREEKQKAIDALKISAPVMVVTQEEFNDYIQTLNKVMNWLEQEPCGDAIDRTEAIRVASGFCHPANVPKELAKLPPVTPQATGHPQKYCDRNICVSNEYNGIGCDECEVTKSQEPKTDVLDKIRAEIEKKHARAKQMSSVLQMNAYTDCLQIIDKYRAESEE